MGGNLARLCSKDFISMRCLIWVHFWVFCGGRRRGFSAAWNDKHFEALSAGSETSAITAAIIGMHPPISAFSPLDSIEKGISREHAIVLVTLLN